MLLKINRGDEMSNISYYELIKRFIKATASPTVFSYIGKVHNKTQNKLNELRGKLSINNIKEILNDLPRHNSFDYINNESLPENYFAYANETLNDPHIYIILSNTGSPASDLISLFTNKKYNHVSISFDEYLKTIVSYNGGEKISPPGLNYELLQNYNKRSDSSIIVYRLKCTIEQKKYIIGRIKKINTEGSAYNLLGLVLKYSHKKNIMFCSQFVYKMLKDAGLSYFDKEETEVKPMDMVELDYQRKLEYVYEIKLSDIL
jgi:hypothetical protein